MADYKRLTIDIEAGLHAELVRSAEERGISLGELIRRAVALDRYVWRNRELVEPLAGVGAATHGVDGRLDVAFDAPDSALTKRERSAAEREDSRHLNGAHRS